MKATNLSAVTYLFSAESDDHDITYIAFRFPLSACSMFQPHSDIQNPLRSPSTLQLETFVFSQKNEISTFLGFRNTYASYAKSKAMGNVRLLQTMIFLSVCIRKKGSRRRIKTNEQKTKTQKEEIKGKRKKMKGDVEKMQFYSITSHREKLQKVLL